MRGVIGKSSLIVLVLILVCAVSVYGAQTHPSLDNAAPVVVSNTSSPGTVAEVTPSWKISMNVTDADGGDTIIDYVQFFINGSSYGSLVSAVVVSGVDTNIANLSNSTWTRGSNLTAECWAGDGTVNTSLVNITYTSVSASNTAPWIISNVSYPNPPLAGYAWKVNATAADYDADTITVYTQFYFNTTASGAVQSRVVSNNTNTQVASITLGATSYHDTVTAEMWVGDGTINSSRANMTALPTIVKTITVAQAVTPADMVWNTSKVQRIQFTPTAGNNTIVSCALWTNISGTWASNVTNSTITSGAVNNLIWNSVVDKGVILWGIKCTDNYSDVYNSTNRTLRIDSTVPVAATVTGVSDSTTITISWSGASDVTLGVVNYTVYADGVLNTSGITGTSFTYSSLTPGTSHDFIVETWDNATNMANSSTYSLATIAPSAGSGSENLPPSTVTPNENVTTPVTSPINSAGGIPVDLIIFGVLLLAGAYWLRII